MTKGSVSAAEHRVQSNGLEHRVLEWSRPSSTGVAEARAPAHCVVLVHGFMDAAGTWDLVAPTLAEQGYRVLAPDMRGFGDGDRAPRGSYYHFADYVADLAGIVSSFSPNEHVALVGHSMGGTITTLFAGAFPERVRCLATLEGLGPPDNACAVGPVRMRRWIEQLSALQERGAPTALRREDARKRLVMNHPGVPPEVLEHRLPHLLREVEGPDGAPLVEWRFDPLHRTTSPAPFFAKLFVEFAKQVTCPVLYVSGGPTGFHVPDEEERLAAFAHLRRKVLHGAGHMMHWTQPAELASLLVELLRE